MAAAAIAAEEPEMAAASSSEAHPPTPKTSSLPDVTATAVHKGQPGKYPSPNPLFNLGQQSQDKGRGLSSAKPTRLLSIAEELATPAGGVACVGPASTPLHAIRGRADAAGRRSLGVAELFCLLEGEIPI